ncbi:MAG: SUMF1/EgtB/PvdO family nonheme iron enzyme [Deltaproteobacteria bacterium]|nr:SUMF1/EgtB/PvdO family nonheme iron enzyme [Deltaproteobacteria bacterium]
MSPRIFLPLLLAGCVEIVDPPGPTASVPVPYGPKVYLADFQADFECKFAGPVGKDESGRTTIGGNPIDGTEFIVGATNCYVRVKPGTLWMDAHEVTNQQFQLCVDSDACNNPNPSDANKSNTCESSDQFDECPVIGVPHFEAQRYCEWVGRRVPSGVEHTIARSRVRKGNVVTTPSTPADISAFPNGNSPPSSDCDAAVLAGCGKPQPVEKLDPISPIGAATADITADGIYDLMGNVSEWAADLIPPLRAKLEGWPWFCAEPIPDGATACPEGRACVYGRKVVGTDPVDNAPVCITTNDLVIRSGALGTFAGGNFGDLSVREPSEAGTFAHKTLENAGEQDESATAINGFRCAGRGGSGTRDSPVPAP